MSHRIAACAALALTVLLACTRLQPSGQLLQEARRHRAEGDLRAAVIQLKNALQQSPDDGAVRQLLGEVYAEQGDAASAEKELRRALAHGGERATVLLVLGKALLMQGEYQRLLTELATEPDGDSVLALRGEAQLGLGKPDLAAPLFRQALQLKPGSVDALLGLARLALARQQHPEAMRFVAQAIAAQPREITALRFKGDLLRSQGRLDAARLVYESILTLRPNQLQARLDLAGLDIQAGQLDQAQAQIAAARKQQPNSLLIYHAQAALDFNRGKPRQALGGVQQVLRAAPDHPPSLLLAAAIELALDDTAQARAHLLKFLDAVPRHAYATQLLASTALRTRQPQEALHLLQPLADGADAGAALLAIAGEAAMQTQQFELANRYFERAAGLSPQAAALHAARGLSLLGMGEHPRAIAELEKAMQRQGASPQAGVLLVLSHLRNRDFVRALQLAEQMVRQGDNPMLQNLRGGVLVASGDLRGARAGFEQALKLQPGYLPALENLTQLDLMENRPAQARQRLAAVLAKDKANTGVMIALSRLALHQGGKAEAIGWLERASAAKPDALEPALMLAGLQLRSGARDKGMILARKLHATNPANPEVLSLLAQAEADGGQHAQALESYSKLALLQPSSAAVQMRIASEQMALSRTGEALKAVRRALALEPERDEAIALASALLIDRNALPEAVTLAQGVQRRRPGDALGFKLEGDALQAQGKHGDALRRYEKGFELMRSGPLLISIHRALRAAGKRADAAARIGQWLQQNPADAPTRLYLASALLQDGEFRAASEHYQRILGKDPDNVLALNDLAWCYLQMDDRRAQAHAERAYRLAPANPAVADTLGAVLIRQGQAARAVPLLKKAVEQAPALPDIRLHYAQALFDTGDRHAARVQCEQLLALKSLAQRDAVLALMARLQRRNAGNAGNADTVGKTGVSQVRNVPAR